MVIEQSSELLLLGVRWFPWAHFFDVQQAVLHSMAVLLGPVSVAVSYTGSRQKPFTFRPPKNNRLLSGLAKVVLPLALRLAFKIVKVEVTEADLRRLRDLKRLRVVLTPSHGALVEPYILFHLSKLLSQEFNYVAAKEAFERRPALGLLIQRLGAYSIVRGTADRKSFRMTHKILVEGKRWLVIFPEGEVCGQNDTLMPFQQGVAQFAFWACEDLTKRGEALPLYFVPMAIKFVYLRDMDPTIDRSLQKLEHKLVGPNPRPLSLYDRLRRVGEAVLSAIEKKYNVLPGKDADLNQRVQFMKELIVSRIETELGVSPRRGQPLLDRIRFLFNMVDRIVFSDIGSSDYEQQLNERRQKQAQGLYEDLRQVLRFIVVHDGYVRESPTAERFLDLLGMLEWEVFERRPSWGPRKAIVKIGEPLNVAAHLPRYRADKRGALQEVTMSLESSVRRMLAELNG